MTTDRLTRADAFWLGALFAIGACVSTPSAENGIVAFELALCDGALAALDADLLTERYPLLDADPLTPRTGTLPAGSRPDDL